VQFAAFQTTYSFDVNLNYQQLSLWELWTIEFNKVLMI